MNAYKFVAEYGLEKAKNLLDRLVKFGVSGGMKFGVINEEWHRTSNGFTWNELKQAIADFELANTAVEELRKTMFSDGVSNEHIQNWILKNGKILTKKGNLATEAIQRINSNTNQAKCEVLDMVDVSPSCEVWDEQALKGGEDDHI